MAPVKPTATLSPAKDKTCDAFAKKGKNVEVLITVLLSTKRPDAFGLDSAQVDWDLVASRLGLKNPKVASVRFGQVKKELIECAESMNLINSAAGSTTTSGGDAKSEEGENLTPPETPVKVKPDPEAKKRSPRGKVAKGNAKSGTGRGRGKKAAKIKDEEAEAEPVVEEQGSNDESREDSPEVLE
ncbi:hypothetical protein TWF481_008014 [Arthrobotrys musiformis]|uniref:Uncharacterized protein n=1 Tax=Arthrobotrys musiformis TaxID=47236 RepID=A0AAV9WBM8_9PEZI